jgi:hypothetical protein
VLVSVFYVLEREREARMERPKHHVDIIRPEASFQVAGGENIKDLFAFLSIHVDWVGLDGFKSRTSQNPSYFFPIPSNPHVTGITEQALKRVPKG